MSVDLYPDGIYKCEEGRWSRIGPLSPHAVLGEVMAELEKHIIETEGGSYLLDFYTVQRVLSRYFV